MKTKPTKRNLIVEGSNSCEDYEWEDLCMEISTAMDENTLWKAEMHNFGWLKQNGYKYFTADSGSKLLQAILPDTDCSFRVYKYQKGLAINNAHHDSPMWSEWYIIKPVTEKEYESN